MALAPGSFAATRCKQHLTPHPSFSVAFCILLCGSLCAADSASDEVLESKRGRAVCRAQADVAARGMSVHNLDTFMAA